MTETKTNRSKLFPLGIWFIIIGFILPIVIVKMAWGMEFEGESTRAVLLLISAVVGLLFPLGIIFTIVGFVKNRKASKQ